jgi:hypothetical protein
LLAELTSKTGLRLWTGGSMFGRQTCVGQWYGDHGHGPNYIAPCWRKPSPSIDLRNVRPTDASFRVVHKQRTPRNKRRGHGRESSEPDVVPQFHAVAIVTAVIDCPSYQPDQTTRATQEPPSSILGDCRWCRLLRFVPCLPLMWDLARMLDGVVPLTICGVKPQCASRGSRSGVRRDDGLG